MSKEIFLLIFYAPLQPLQKLVNATYAKISFFSLEIRKEFSNNQVELPCDRLLDFARWFVCSWPFLYCSDDFWQTNCNKWKKNNSVLNLWNYKGSESVKLRNKVVIFANILIFPHSSNIKNWYTGCPGTPRHGGSGWESRSYPLW